MNDNLFHVPSLKRYNLSVQGAGHNLRSGTIGMEQFSKDVSLSLLVSRHGLRKTQGSPSIMSSKANCPKQQIWRRAMSIIYFVILKITLRKGTVWIFAPQAPKCFVFKIFVAQLHVSSSGF